MQATPIRNQGKSMDIKITAPMMAESVFANIRNESGGINETSSAKKKGAG
jgi:hypothetical protein